MGKRKAEYETVTTKVVKKPKGNPKAQMKGTPGRSRTSGYYGRFQGPSGELKFFDTALSFNVDTTPEVPATGQLCLIPQGVTESTRVGRKCTIKSIQIEGAMQFTPGAVTSGATLVTLALVQDTQTNGAAAAYSDIYDGSVFCSAVRNIENGDRFKILKKWEVNLSAAAGIQSAFSNSLKKWSYYKKVQIPLEFSSTTGAITELRSNNVFLVAGALASDDTVAVIGTARVRYSDN